MIIQTTRFGEVEVGEQDIITLPQGLLGFSTDRLYVLLDDDNGSPFKWLQSIERPKLAFVTINPAIAITNYSLALSKEHLQKLEAAAVEELSVSVIVTMTKDLKDVTINLQGPLIINMKRRLGFQMVVTEGAYSTRQPLFGDKLQLNAEMPEQRSQKVESPRLAAVG